MHTNTNTFEASGKQNQQMRRYEIENHKLSRMRSNQGGKKERKLWLMEEQVGGFIIDLIECLETEKKIQAD